MAKKETYTIEIDHDSGTAFVNAPFGSSRAYDLIDFKGYGKNPDRLTYRDLFAAIGEDSDAYN